MATLTDASATPQKSVPVALLILGLPIVGSMLSRSVMGFVDFIMVSRLGPEAQAAIFPASVTLFCLIGFGFGVMSLVSAFVSQALGRGDRAACGAFGWQGLWVSLGFGALVLPAWWLVRPIFTAAGHAPAVVGLEVAYVQVGLIGVGPAVAAIALSNFFNGVHRPAVGLVTTVIANGFNILGDWVLIFGKLGFPAMGIAGAAWATVAASTLHTLLLIAWMLRPALHERFNTRATWRPDPARIRRLLARGTPAGVQFAIEIATFAVFTIALVGHFGTTQLAASNVAFQLYHIAMMVCIGMAIATTAAVGRAIGEGDPARARSVAHWAVALCLIYLAACATLYFTAGRWMAAQLGAGDEVSRWAWRLLMIAAVLGFGDAIQFIYAHALRGAGDTLWQAVVAAILAVVVMLGGGIAAIAYVPEWAAAGPWIAMSIYIYVQGLVFWWRFREGKWEQTQLADADAPVTRPDDQATRAGTAPTVGS